MAGIASKPSSRLTAAGRVAVLIAIGSFSVGLGACGSDESSPDEGGSTAPIVEKEAGYKDVQLGVENKGPDDDITATLCRDLDQDLNDSENCPVGGYLGPGESYHFTYEEVSGRIGYTNPDKNFAGIEYRVHNPLVGDPSFDVWPTGVDHREDPQNFAPAEGKTLTKEISGHTYDFSRAPDTDVKVMTLTVH
jgi:hypothetical protein